MIGKQKNPVILKVILILEVVIVVGLVFVLFKLILPQTANFQQEPSQGEITTEVVITPSDILANKARYNNQNLVVRGRVTLERVVCQKMDCPAEDKCCGCPEERNLAIKDQAKPLGSEEKGLLRLFDSKHQPLCQRSKTSCDYHCGDWIDDAIYDVSGIFFAEPPTTGLKMSFNYFLQVEDKKIVQKSGIGDFVKNAFNDAVKKFKEWTTSGSYVLD